MLNRLSDWYDFPLNGRRGELPFELLRERFDRLFQELQQGTDDGFKAQGWPRFSVTDRGPEFVIVAEVPGLSEQDFDISANAQTLTVRGERKDEVPQGYSTHRKERRAFRFARSFDLPSKIDPDRVSAELKHGVLTLTLPKAAEAQPKQITVKAG